MHIFSLKLGNGRGLYGKLKCRHCNALEDLRGGYDDSRWHMNVLPAFHCKACGLNEDGEAKSPEVTARNQANGVNGI